MIRSAIDFSAKHDVLIRRKDGRLVPMDEPCYEVEKIGEGTWKIMSSGDYHYLVEGDEEAIGIDTGYGAGNLREFLQTLTGKPVRSVINTHHHFDHTANNCYFEKVYMAEEGVDLAAIPYPSFEGVAFPRDYETVVVENGTIIPLKGRELEIFKIGDHTEDGIAILDRKGRNLYTGDEFMSMGKRIEKGLKKWQADLSKLQEHRGEFDRLCGGPDVFDAEMFDVFMEACNRILAGEPSEEAPDRKPPKRPEISADGPVIYDCQFPHPEDMPKFLRKPGESDGKIHYFYKGYEFSYKKED